MEERLENMRMERTGPAFLALEMESKALGQGMLAAHRHWNRQGNSPPLERPERNAALITL